MTRLKLEEQITQATDDIVTTLMSHSSALIASGGVALMLYKKLTVGDDRPAPITNDRPWIDRPFFREENYTDLKSYQDLCGLRITLDTKMRGLFGVTPAQGVLPKEWELDKEHRPTWAMSFKDNANQLKELANIINEGDYPHKFLVQGILEKISNLFSSLGKRFTWTRPGEYQHYRSDGFEAMFFSDLAHWLVSTLVLQSDKKTSTVECIELWIAYCEKVQRDVLIDRDKDVLNLLNLSAVEKSRLHSPTPVLNDVIGLLKKLKTNIEKVNKAVRLNDRIDSIDRQFLHVIRNTFKVWHLLNKDSDHKPLQVKAFLDNIKTREDTNKPISKLEKWQAATLRKVMITEIDYESVAPLSIADLGTYLVGEDSVFDFETSGLWDFLRPGGSRDSQQVMRNIAQGYFSQIHAIHPLLIQFCFIRKSMLSLSKVSAIFGQSWVYGEDTGKAPLCVLLDIIDDINSKLINQLTTFWTQYYWSYQVYLKSIDRLLDRHDPVTKKAYEIDDLIKELAQYRKSIVKEIETIKADMAQSEEQIEDTKQELRNLIGNLLQYIDVTGFQVRDHGTVTAHLKAQLKVLNNATVRTTPNVLVDRQMTYGFVQIAPPANESSNDAPEIHVKRALAQGQCKQDDHVFVLCKNKVFYVNNEAGTVYRMDKYQGEAPDLDYDWVVENIKQPYKRVNDAEKTRVVELLRRVPAQAMEVISQKLQYQLKNVALFQDVAMLLHATVIPDEKLKSFLNVSNNKAEIISTSQLQKALLDPIVEKHKAIVSGYKNPYWFFDGSWWYQFINSPVKNMDSFVDFHVRLSAAMRRISEIIVVNGVTNTGTDQRTAVEKAHEQQLIDVLLYKSIVQAFRKNQYFDLNLTSIKKCISECKVTRAEGHITFAFKTFALRLPCDGPFNETLARVFEDDWDTVQHLEMKSSGLEEQLRVKTAEAEARKTELIEKIAEYDALAAQLAENKRQLDEQLPQLMKQVERLSAPQHSQEVRQVQTSWLYGLFGACSATPTSNNATSFNTNLRPI